MSRDINQEKLEESKRHQFDAYCKKILRNEARLLEDLCAGPRLEERP